MKYNPEDEFSTELGLEKGSWSDCGKEFDELIDNRYPVYSESQYKILTDQEIKRFDESTDNHQKSSIPKVRHFTY